MKRTAKETVVYKGVSIPPGTPTDFDKKTLDFLEDRGLLEPLPAKAEAATKTPTAKVVAPTGDELTAAIHTVFDNLTDDEWGVDRVPNVALMNDGLSALCGCTVRITAAERAAALDSYRPAE